MSAGSKVLSCTCEGLYEPEHQCAIDLRGACRIFKFCRKKFETKFGIPTGWFSKLKVKTRGFGLNL
jgi:hypothetical protein